MRLSKNLKLELLLPKAKDNNLFIVDKRSSNSIGAKEIKIGERYLKIDGSYSIKAIDGDYLEKIRMHIGEEAQNYEYIYSLINEIFKKNIFSNFEDIFDYSFKISKQLVENKDLVELMLQQLLKLNQTYFSQTLLLSSDILCSMGKILSFSYKKLESYKIKDFDKLKQLIEKAKKEEVNIFMDYIMWSSTQNNKNIDEKFSKFFQKNKKKYEIPPEMLALINTYQDITKIELDIDKLNPNFLKEEDLKYCELAIMNIHWVLKSLKEIKFVFISKELESALFMRKREKFNDFCTKVNCNFKPKDIFFNDIFYFKPKWNFSNKYQIINNKDINSEPFIEDFYFEDDKKNIENTLTVVQNFSNLFEIIFICFFSLNLYENKKLNFELIMNNCYNIEYFILFKDIYKLEWAKSNSFHIFDLLLFKNLITNIQQLNIEINCLNKKTFRKLQNFLYYNDSITKFNISFFSSDLTYLPQNLYMTFSELFDNIELANNELKKNFDENTYLFCDIKEIEDKIVDKFFPDFVDSLATFYEIIYSKKNLKELGFDIDAPFIIRNKSKYMNSIYKFILNILFYVSKQKIEKFTLISPYTIIDPVTNPGVDSLINSINFQKNKYYEELTLQMQFYNLQSVSSFLNGRLRILNIGNMDLFTFKNFCYSITKYRFNKNSSLQELSIGLIGSITEFNEEIKFLFRKLFEIKINSLSKLTLFTGLCLTDKNMYIDFLKLMNYNWITNYIITFDDSSNNIFENEKNSLDKLRSLVPCFLEKRMKEYKNIKNRTDIYDNDSYWFLKYLFKHKYKLYKSDKQKEKSDDELIKEIVFNILSYVYISQIPKIIHKYENENNS